MRTLLEVELHADPDAPHAAREALHEVAGALPLDVLDDARLLVSELVASSTQRRRPGEAIAMTVRLDEAALRVEVAERAAGRRPPEAILLEAAGWSIYIVSAVADRWGIEGGTRTTAWFELDLPGIKEGERRS
jgi:hypothetical protein